MSVSKPILLGVDLKDIDGRSIAGRDRFLGRRLIQECHKRGASLHKKTVRMKNPAFLRDLRFRFARPPASLRGHPCSHL